MKKIKVFSAFNGMNCIGLALTKLGVEFELYASEIDKYANQVSSALFPNTINLGDVTKIDIDSLPTFDLIVAGSPCQGFSFAGKQLNFDDDRSKLFFDFVKILEACRKKNPNIKFLLENVKMKKEYEAVISRFMGIDPIEINSALLSAQNRKRLYWTNIGTTKANLFGIEEPGIKQPEDKGILLKDILELEVDERFYLKLDKKLKPKNNQNKASCFTAGGNSGGNHSDMDLIAIKCAAMRGRYKENGKRKDLKGGIKGKSKQEIEIRQDDKTNCLTSVQKDNLLISSSKIRRLTPRECARLQTVPEWTIDKMLDCGVSDSQLYKILGNGWTIDVISYILQHNDWTKCK